jgi:hypothetical protein
MVFKGKYIYGVGAFEAYLLKVSALKLSHPSACPVFKDFSYFSPITTQSPYGERKDGRRRHGHV